MGYSKQPVFTIFFVNHNEIINNKTTTLLLNKNSLSFLKSIAKSGIKKIIIKKLLIKKA